MKQHHLLGLCAIALLFACESQKVKKETQVQTQQSPYQTGSYSDNFHYVKGEGNADSNSFNNWYYAMYPYWESDFDSYVSFSFNDSTISGSNYCSKLTIKKSPDPSNVQYQDAEMFNNACVPNQYAQSSQPTCNVAFPYGRLQHSHPPYAITSAMADTGALYDSISVNLGLCNSPYYPSESVAYKLKIRAKADGPTYGSRGWGFWNTQFTLDTAANLDYFAWFFEWGINFDLGPDTDKIPLVFPSALTLSDDSVTVSILILNPFEKFIDYEILWSAQAVEYYVNGTLVASHSSPPKADYAHRMAFHNWVDNRLYCTSCGTNTYAPIPFDKSNYIDEFKAEPVKNYVKNMSTPFSLITVSFPRSDYIAEKSVNEGKDNKGGKPAILDYVIQRLMNEHGDEIRALAQKK